MSDKDYKGKKGADGDDYKPLKFYQKRIAGTENGFDTFSEGGEHYFTYNIDGEVILISEGYASEKGRDNGVASVDKNRLIDKRYRRDTLEESGKHFFNLVAGNHQEIATSAWFDSDVAMEAAIARLMGISSAPLASVMSAVAPVAAAKIVDDIPPKQEKKEEEDEGCGCAWLWWLLPLLLALLVWYLFSQCCQKPSEIVPAVVPAAPEVVKPVEVKPELKVEAPPAVSGNDISLGDFFMSKLPSGTDLNIPEFGIENKLIQFIEDDSRPIDKTTWFSFDRIGFDTSKADLTLDSREQIRNIAEIMRAYPNVKLKIGGYTDNTGSLAFNQTLSDERAKSVMNSLISQGVTQDRLSAEGYGPQFPVASNETEEGRAKNRRIDIRVTEK
ncbi:MAG: OmpA family protein [Cellvibrionaceae bacterium]